MYCYNCGAFVKEGSNFCDQCGRRVVKPAPQVKKTQTEWDRVFTPELIEGAKRKDERALTFLYKETVERIFAAVRSVVSDEDTANDVVQDAYIKAFRALDQLESPGAFPAWLMRIAMNRSYDYLRKKKPDVMFSSLEDDKGKAYEFEDTRAENLPHVVIEQREAADLLREILNEIPEEQRLCMTMFYYNQMDVKEIARELSCPEGTVKNRLFLGRKKMEVKVKELEKKGIKLYGLAPVAFFLVILRNMEAAVPPAYVGEAVLAGTLNTSASAAVGTASGGAKAGTGAIQTGAVKAGTVKIGAAAAAKGAGLSVGKTIAIIAAVAAVGTTTTVALATHKPTPQVAEVVSESVSVSETTPETTPEITPEATPEPTPEATPEPTPEAEQVNMEDVIRTYACASKYGFGPQGDSKCCIADLDGDGVPELIAEGGAATESWLMLFTYQDGQIKSLCGITEDYHRLEVVSDNVKYFYEEAIRDFYSASDPNHHIDAKSIFLAANYATGNIYDFDCEYKVGYDTEKKVIIVNVEKPESTGESAEYDPNDYIQDPMKAGSGVTYFYRITDGELELLNNYEYEPGENNEMIMAEYSDCSFTYIDFDKCFGEGETDKFMSNYQDYMQ